VILINAVIMDGAEITSSSWRSDLVIGSDCRSASPGSDQELTFGAGAAAYILGAEKAIVEVEALHSYSSYFQRRLDEQGPPLGRHRCWSNS